MELTFKKVTMDDLPLIYSWLNEPHVKEFWDNSEAHHTDIKDFASGMPRPSLYGSYVYWIGYIDNDPYAFLLTSKFEKDDTDLHELHLKNLSKTGNTYGIDFCIGNTQYLDKGLASLTLKSFISFFHQEEDTLADTFFIDPDESNPRAMHVYEKAGFKTVGTFEMKQGYFKGAETYLMVLVHA